MSEAAMLAGNVEKGLRMASEERRPGLADQLGYLRADEAIQGREEDRLGRSRLAEDIAAQVIHGPRGLGLVIGLVGEWGTGKTSVINMVRECVGERSDTVMLSFDPWLFSGTDELVTRFLQELGAQLREASGSERGSGVAKASEALLGYAAALEPLGWLPAVGPWMARTAILARGIKGLRSERAAEPSAQTQRDEVRKTLAALNRRVLVTVDDLDRLESEQIRDVMRLVRLVGNFPNTTYLLAYSRRAVEQALSTQSPRAGGDQTSHDGALYLEKIVQAVHNLPQINPRLLLRAFANELEAAIADIECGPFDRQRWPDILIEGILPFLTTVRASSRLLNVLPTTLRLLGDRVALVDVIALETIRLFAPAAWDLLPESVAALTGEYPLGNDGAVEQRRGRDIQQVGRICDADREHTDGVTAIVRRVFPRADAFLDDRLPPAHAPYPEDRRVCDPEILRIYLRRQVTEKTVGTALVQRAITYAKDRGALKRFFESLDPHRAEETIIGIGDREAMFGVEEAAALVEVLVNQSVRMSAQQMSPLDLTPSEQVLRVAVRLLWNLNDQQTRYEALSIALARVKMFSARLALLELVAQSMDEDGESLVSDQDAATLVCTLCHAVQAASMEALAKERSLFGLIALVVRDGSSEWSGGERREGRGRCGERGDRDRRNGDDSLTFARRCSDDNDVLLRLLESSMSAQRVSLGHHRRQPTLPWVTLARWVSDEDRLKSRIGDIADAIGCDEIPPDLREALETAQRYASGASPQTPQ